MQPLSLPFLTSSLYFLKFTRESHELHSTAPQPAQSRSPCWHSNALNRHSTLKPMRNIIIYMKLLLLFCSQGAARGFITLPAGVAPWRSSRNCLTKCFSTFSSSPNERAASGLNNPDPALSGQLQACIPEYTIDVVWSLNTSSMAMTLPSKLVSGFIEPLH